MIRFRCPGCSKNLKAKDSMAGKRVTCPCGQELRIPNPQPAVRVETSDQDKIRTSCTGCHRKLKVESKHRGKLLRCPCGVKFRVDQEHETAPSPSHPTTVDSLQSTGAGHLQTTGAKALPPSGFEALPPTSTNNLSANGFDDLPPIVPNATPAGTAGGEVTETGFPNVDLPQPVSPAFLPPAPQPAAAPQASLSSSTNPLLKKAMDEEAAGGEEDEEEEDSWYVQIGSGLFCVAIAIGLFMLLNNMEQSGGRMRVPWYIAIAYYLGGKWVVGGALFVIGVLATGLGIAAAFKTQSDVKDDSV